MYSACNTHDLNKIFRSGPLNQHSQHAFFHQEVHGTFLVPRNFYFLSFFFWKIKLSFCPTVVKQRTLLGLFYCQPSPSIAVSDYVLVYVSLGGYSMCVYGLISEEHRELQQLHRCKKEEYEGVVLKLQSRIKRANDELDQVRAILRNLKEANGHG